MHVQYFGDTVEKLHISDTLDAKMVCFSEISMWLPFFFYQMNCGKNEYTNGIHTGGDVFTATERIESKGKEFVT